LGQHNIRNIHRKTDLLYRSYLVFLVAAWEVFVEDLARAAHNSLLELEPDIEKRKAAISELEKNLEDFHSPNVKKINLLFKKFIGIDNIIMSVAWQGMKPHEVVGKLSDLIRIRGNIAHTVYSSKALQYDASTYFDDMRFLYNVACVLNNKVSAYLQKRTGKIILPQVQVEYATGIGN
jgi:hypothetical protein